MEGLEEVNEIEDKTFVEDEEQDEVAETEDEEDVNLLVDAVDSTDEASENSEYSSDESKMESEKRNVGCWERKSGFDRVVSINGNISLTSVDLIGSMEILLGRIMLIDVKLESADSTGLVIEEAMNTGATDIDSDGSLAGQITCTSSL